MPLSSSKDLTIVYKPDSSITAEEDRQIRHLLFSCFPYEPAFLTRRYVKQPPQHRWLVFGNAGELAAHAALHDKLIGTKHGDLRVGGICEVCVASSYRGAGLVKKLLQTIHTWLVAQGIPFSILFGQPKVYGSSGYVLVHNELRADNSLARHWNPFCGKFMVKQLAGKEWHQGAIDLRGPTF